MYSYHHLETSPRQSQITPIQDQIPDAVQDRSNSYSPPVSTTSMLQSNQRYERFPVGEHTFFSAGQFANKIVRMELHEIQKADLGRKYARVDRRPLDPPPVVQLRLFELRHAGTDHEVETEMKYDDIQVLGLLCTVDLFPVPGDIRANSQVNHADRSEKLITTPVRQASSLYYSESSALSTAYGPEGYDLAPDSQPSTRIPNYNAYPAEYSPHSTPTQSSDIDMCSGDSSANASHFSGYILPSQPAPDIIHYLDDIPITESSKQTQALVGATFVQPALIEYHGSKAIMFVFSDLAVKIEGTFILRYRAFDIFSRPSGSDTNPSVTAETYGGPFRVYSTKEFPGLSASTELTKHLARWGVRLNIRETERRRKRQDSE